jgi:hypothetical protein
MSALTAFVLAKGRHALPAMLEETDSVLPPIFTGQSFLPSL